MVVAKPRQAVARFRVEAVVAVTNTPKNPSNALQALTAAAIALPGLLSPALQAAEEEQFALQYGHYEEGKRDLGNVQSHFQPIAVDSVLGVLKLKFTDRLRSVFNFTQDTWSGATPIATAPMAIGGNHIKALSGASPYLSPSTPVKLNGQLQPQLYNAAANSYVPATQLVHTLAMASPETRKQGDFKLNYEWDNAAVDMGAGLSHERDYESVFGSVGGRLDLNQKRTSVSTGVSYTSSTTNALLDHDATPYIYETSTGLKSYNSLHNTSQIALSGALNSKVLQAEREDWGTHLGLTQILHKNALVEAGFSYTRSSGYLSNPYKVVTTVFVDPLQSSDSTGLLTGATRSLMDNRPDLRNQWSGSLGYVQHIDTFDASMHLNYRLFHDDWGITAHTFEADWIQPLSDGWTLTPRIRYYTQSAADFYYPYLVSKQAAPANQRLVNYANLPSNYSSDHRLSGYGALSGGLMVSKKFAKGVTLEAGAEYYTHAGSLKLGGGGEGAYADFNSYMVNAALKVDLAALSLPGTAHAGHAMHTQHAHGSHAPAGVMFDHVLHQAGDSMVGYRYMYMRQQGDTLQAGGAVNDAAIVQRGCQGEACYVTPLNMSMHMHMLDLMYAPTDWLTLMLMPQFVDMNMDFRKLDGSATPGFGSDISAAVMHADHTHETGGIGDTGMYALFKLFSQDQRQINATLGFSAPTGDVGIKLRDTHQVELGYIHYAMQLGSGTWDFKPSITYTDQWDAWSWGAQINGTKRLASHNASGFAFGDLLQTTAWGSYSLLNWLSASVRGIYTLQGELKGAYNGAYTKIGPMDYSSNYGGRFWDVGFGLSAFVPSGDLQGNRLSFEWIQPVSDDVNGYQLEREGALSATWSLML